MSTTKLSNDHQMPGVQPEGDHGAPDLSASVAETPGLAIADEDFRIDPIKTGFDAPGRQLISFRVLDAVGQAVTSFEEEQERELHLILVGRDLAGYQHLHPVRDEAGIWSVEASLDRAGPYRVLADFESGGAHKTLGYDISVAGEYTPVALERPAVKAETAGYDVALEESAADRLSFVVSRRGKPLRDLQPYLGSQGHLVVLREGDLAYLHVHPEAGDHTGTISFMAHYPSPGRYRLYLQFKHEDKVQTAEFTQEVNDGSH